MELYYKLAQEKEVYNILEIIKEELSGINLEAYVDNADNIIVRKKGTGKKVMVSTVIKNPRLCITNIKSDNIAEVSVSEEYRSSDLCGLEAISNKGDLGIVRCAEDVDKSSEKDVSLHIELWDEKLANVADICYIKSNIYCKGDLLYGFNTSPLILTKILIDTIKQHVESVNDIYFTLSFSDFGLVSAVKKINPETLYFVYEVNADKNFKISNGCGIVYKDGNAIVAADVIKRETEVAKNNNICVQPFVGKQNKLLETLGITADINEICALCVPVKHLKSNCEVIDVKDVKSVGIMLVNML